MVRCLTRVVTGKDVTITFFLYGQVGLDRMKENTSDFNLGVLNMKLMSTWEQQSCTFLSDLGDCFIWWGSSQRFEL